MRSRYGVIFYPQDCAGLEWTARSSRNGIISCRNAAKSALEEWIYRTIASVIRNFHLAIAKNDRIETYYSVYLVLVKNTGRVSIFRNYSFQLFVTLTLCPLKVEVTSYTFERSRIYGIERERRKQMCDEARTCRHSGFRRRALSNVRKGIWFPTKLRLPYTFVQQFRNSVRSRARARRAASVSGCSAKFRRSRNGVVPLKWNRTQIENET